MSRVIKFRGWDGSRMIMPEDKSYYQHYMSFCGNIVQSSSEGMACFGGQDNWRVKRDLQLMQFTGLLDANGVEVYESDIIARKDDTSLTQVVEWCTKKTWRGMADGYNVHHIGFNIDEYFFQINDFVVIGNIHQHPELLK